MAKQETFKHVSNQMLLEAVKDQNWDLARTIVYEDASYAEVYDSAGNLPLHLSVTSGCPPDLLAKLLIANPGSIRLRDPAGNLPLHLSAYHNKGRLWINISENTTLLYAAYPDAVRELDKGGNLAIHIAFRYRAPDELIRFLLSSYPGSAKLKDGFGNLPLHLAVQFQASTSLVELVMTTYPEALGLRNATGNLPLHKAAQFNSPMEVLRLIVDADGSAAAARDDRGNLPLHLLFLFCAGPPSEERLSLMIRSNPGALGVPNNEGAVPFMMMNRPKSHYVQDYR
mmetsp:Transcript_3995/g.8997  ORF Transcript_3995/g.8997 Transcript_3995/m.8997 type:complete len:284 (+) Transcript_3995:125-976(+)